MLGCWFLSSRAPLRSCDSIFATQVYLPRLYGSSLSSARRVFSLFHFCSSSLAGNKKESWSWSMWDQSLLMKSWGLKLISLLWVEQLSLGKKVPFWLCWDGTSADLIQGKTLPHNHPLEGLGVKGEDPQGEGVFPCNPQWGVQRFSWFPTDTVDVLSLNGSLPGTLCEKSGHGIHSSGFPSGNRDPSCHSQCCLLGF